VEWTAVVNPTDNASLKATADRSLTLVTCYPFRYVGPAPQRFIVRARQVAPEASRSLGIEIEERKNG
jgi:LPXTG-site transpeptidase (sortase) family protein